MWGETTVYSQLFGINISSMFLLRTTNKTGEFLAHPIGLHHSHHRRFAYLSPLITGLFASSPFSRGSHPQEVSVKTSKRFGAVERKNRLIGRQSVDPALLLLPLYEKFYYDQEFPRTPTELNVKT